MTFCLVAIFLVLVPIDCLIRDIALLAGDQLIIFGAVRYRNVRFEA